MSRDANVIDKESFPGFPEWGRVVRTEEIDTLRLDDVAETDALAERYIQHLGGNRPRP